MLFEWTGDPPTRYLLYISPLLHLYTVLSNINPLSPPLTPPLNPYYRTMFEAFAIAIDKYKQVGMDLMHDVQMS